MAQLQSIRILLVHNYYQQPGGEDVVFAAERDLLQRHGHEVSVYTDHNDRISSMGALPAALNTIWSRESYRAIKKMIAAERPDIVHFHNTFMMISPAAYYACRDAGIPVVQTLHNYRLLCPSATFYRDGKVCENCLGDFFAWQGVRYACYRDSKTQTAGLASMVSFHKIIHTWKERVAAYVVLTGFAREKFIAGGLPASKIVVKPNFVAPDPGLGAGGGGYALFIGRLSGEKGIMTMLKAWRDFSLPVALKIVGDGPLRSEVLKFVADESLANVTSLGSVSHDGVIALMQGARFLIFSSECYEGFPMVVVEAFACGLPVIASSLGGRREMIEDGVTGLLFTSGDVKDLAEKVLWANSHPAEISQMRLSVRKKYLDHYSEEPAYQNILRVYRFALTGDLP